MLANLVQQRGLAPSDVNIRFGFDPIGVLAVNGWNNVVWPDMAPCLRQPRRRDDEPRLRRPVRRRRWQAGPRGRRLGSAGARLRPFHRARLSPRAGAGGIPLDEARRLVFFRLAADQNQFLTTAKFRALRKLWSRVEEACGLEPEPAFVAAETAWRMMTKRDPHGNIVRGTIAALAAAVGGANAVTVLPFSAARRPA